MDKLTLRFRPGQYQVLCELRDALGCSISLIVRAIVSDFLTRNKEMLERIIMDYKETGEPVSKIMEDMEIWG